MRYRHECPGPEDRHEIFEERQAIEWMCQHQLQLQLVTVAETIDHRAEELARNAILAAACLKQLA